MISLSLLSFLFLCSQQSSASQSGPYFPTHNFPTDRSFHLSYDFGVLKTGRNYDETGSSTPLLLNSQLFRYRHKLTPEYQVNRNFNVGAYIQVDSLNLADEDGNTISKKGFSDQVIFSEYRFFDIPGASVGVATLVKFPFYENTTVSKFLDSGEGSTILIGDAQTDFSVMATSELWPSNFIRFRLDFGYTYRSDSFGAEIPYLISAGYVSKKVDIDLRLKGNFSLENDAIVADNSTAAENSQLLQTAFGDSNYALSGNPSATKFETAISFWFDPLWGASASFEKSLRGKNSPQFWGIQFGLTYRFLEREERLKQTAREVDISTDQEKGVFEGEGGFGEDEFY